MTNLFNDNPNDTPQLYMVFEEIQESSTIAMMRICLDFSPEHSSLLVTLYHSEFYVHYYSVKPSEAASETHMNNI